MLNFLKLLKFLSSLVRFQIKPHNLLSSAHEFCCYTIWNLWVIVVLCLNNTSDYNLSLTQWQENQKLRKLLLQQRSVILLVLNSFGISNGRFLIDKSFLCRHSTVTCHFGPSLHYVISGISFLTCCSNNLREHYL